MNQQQHQQQQQLFYYLQQQKQQQQLQQAQLNQQSSVKKQPIPSPSQWTPQQAQVYQQYLASQQVKQSPSLRQTRSSNGTPLSHQQQQQVPSRQIPPSLAPPLNKYILRIKQGGTGLIIPESVVKRKRSTLVISSSETTENDESEEEYDREDSDSDSEGGRRSSKRLRATLSSLSQSVPNPSGPFLETGVDDGRKRMLRQTKHDYARLYIYFYSIEFKNDNRSSGKDIIASTNEVLIPIRIEIDLEGFKMRDNFTWNMNGISFDLQE